jgi:RNA polymerase sigma factor (sigma-70 family)
MTKPPFEDVVAAHGARVLRVCRAVVGPVDAEDAWSETFLSALRAYPDLPGDADVGAWLVTIAHRRALDVHRARSRRPLPVGQLGDADVGQAGARGPGDPDEADPSALVAALSGLAPKQRQCVYLHHIAGYPYADVAQILGGTEAAARRAAADGIAALRADHDESVGPASARTLRRIPTKDQPKKEQP